MYSFLVCQVECVERSLENFKLLSIACAALGISCCLARWPSHSGCALLACFCQAELTGIPKVPKCSNASMLPGLCSHRRFCPAVAPPPTSLGHHPRQADESAKQCSHCRASLPLFVSTGFFCSLNRLEQGPVYFALASPVPAPCFTSETLHASC